MNRTRDTAISGDDLDGDDGDGGERIKSERKRKRERQRRSDLANAFDELAMILSQIEPDESGSMASRQKREKKPVGESIDLEAGNISGSTRLDLISKSVDVLRKLHRENTELKRINERGGEGRDEKVCLRA